MGSGNFERGNWRTIVKYGNTLRSSVQKMAAPIEVQFWLWARMGEGNHVLDWVQIPSWKGVILAIGAPIRDFLP